MSHSCYVDFHGLRPGYWSLWNSADYYFVFDWQVCGPVKEPAGEDLTDSPDPNQSESVTTATGNIQSCRIVKTWNRDGHKQSWRPLSAQNGVIENTQTCHQMICSWYGKHNAAVSIQIIQKNILRICLTPFSSLISFPSPSLSSFVLLLTVLKCEYCKNFAPASQFRGTKRFCSMTCAKRYLTCMK